MKIVTIIGARPQFIKAGPVNRAIDEYNRSAGASKVHEIVVHTGQHYDHNMSQIFFDELKLRHPDYNLSVGSGSHGKMTGAILARVEEVLLKERPDWVLIYGDTNSTLAGALAAAKLNIPIAHVEAGLRSFNRKMPEEINRVVADHVSTMLFCPTVAAVRNLEKEGISQSVHNVGDVMYDAFLFNRELSVKKSRILSDLNLLPSHYCLATLHRQENTEDIDRLENILDAFERVASADRPLIVPLHPRTLKILGQLKDSSSSNGHIRFLPPVGYLDMMSLISTARVILTDSGGVQKEASFARVPCVTLRDETEWVETVASGWNHIGGAQSGNILEAFRKALDVNHERPTAFYGNGNAGMLILEKLTTV
jgi:UDP-GlcNAc3NAcA epimerase